MAPFSAWLNRLCARLMAHVVPKAKTITKDKDESEDSSADESFTTEDYSEYQPDENETKEKELELEIEDALADEAGVDQDEIQED